MSTYYPPYKSSSNNIKVELDLCVCEDDSVCDSKLYDKLPI